MFFLYRFGLKTEGQSSDGMGQVVIPARRFQFITHHTKYIKDTFPQKQTGPTCFQITKDRYLGWTMLTSTGKWQKEMVLVTIIHYQTQEAFPFSVSIGKPVSWVHCGLHITYLEMAFNSSSVSCTFANIKNTVRFACLTWGYFRVFLLAFQFHGLLYIWSDSHKVYLFKVRCMFWRQTTMNFKVNSVTRVQRSFF